MKLTLRVLSGTRAGQAVTFEQRTVSIGRHPGCDLRFDPEGDRAVSAQHAMLLHDEQGWRVRDLGSRNGTRVNGVRVEGDAPLRPGDRITFGDDGPTIEVARPAAAAPVARTAHDEPSTAERLRIDLTRRLRRSHLVAAALTMALVATAGAVTMLDARREDAWNRERTRMQLRMDSLQWAGARTVEALEQQMLGLTRLLSQSEAQVRALEVAVTGAETRGEDAEVARLRRELQVASAALQRQQVAASLDFRSIQQRNRRAVARVFVESESGMVVTATAFAVRPDATLITSRHALLGPDGRSRPRRIAVQFSDSEQVWPARLVAASRDADLAVIRADNILGDVPTVQGLSLRPDTLPAGAPVAMIGFPLGGDADGGSGGLARPLLTAGVLRAVGDERIEVQGYGASGASGSPVLDAAGQVVAVVFGGRTEGGAHTVYAVPSAAAARLIAGLP